MSREFLYEMLKEISVSGKEYRLQKKVMDHMANYVDDCVTDHVGDVIAIKNKESDFRVMLAAHSDEIGLIINRIRPDGRCILDNIGSITPLVYAGQRVQVLTSKGIIYGVIDKPRNKSEINTTDLILDLGVYSKEEAMELVEVGDVLVHDYDYREINDHILAARALDDKIGIYVINEATKRAVARGVKIGIYSTTTVGEETTKNGARFASYAINPTCSISVDVGSDTSVRDNMANSSYTRLGLGPIITVGVTINQELVEIAKKVAKEKNLQLQFNTCNSRTYTDLDAIHYNAGGVPSILVSIPLRYMHSSAELADMNDVEEAIELIASMLEYFDKHQSELNFNPVK